MVGTISGISWYLLNQLKGSLFKDPIFVDLSYDLALMIVPRVGKIQITSDTPPVDFLVEDEYWTGTKGSGIVKFSTLDQYKIDHFVKNDPMDRLILKSSKNRQDSRQRIFIAEVRFPNWSMYVPDTTLIQILELAVLFTLGLNSEDEQTNLALNSLIAVYGNYRWTHNPKHQPISTQIANAYSRNRFGVLDKLNCINIQSRGKDLVKKFLSVPATHIAGHPFMFTETDPILNNFALMNVCDQIQSDEHLVGAQTEPKFIVSRMIHKDKSQEFVGDLYAGSVFETDRMGFKYHIPNGSIFGEFKRVQRAAKIMAVELSKEILEDQNRTNDHGG